MNKAILMGRLVADPTLRTTQSGTQVATFTMAVDRKNKNKDGTRSTDFINCVAWAGKAEFVCRYFGKGAMLSVVGSIQTRQYTDKNGANRTAVEVVVDECYFCGPKQTSQPVAGYDVEPPEDDEELPF